MTMELLQTQLPPDGKGDHMANGKRCITLGQIHDVMSAAEALRHPFDTCTGENLRTAINNMPVEDLVQMQLQVQSLRRVLREWMNTPITETENRI